MPRIIDYPRASLKTALRIAEGVESLGGSCTPEMAAHQLGQKVGGSFQAAISAADKYGLIESSRGKLTVTQLYKHYRLAYSDEERRELLKRAALNVPLFQSVYSRFAGKKLPTDILDRLLIRELSVNEAIASRVAGYFQDAARESGLMDEAGALVSVGDSQGGAEDEPEGREQAPQPPNQQESSAIPVGAYVVSFKGPGMNSSFEVTDTADLHIVDAVLKKIRAKLQKQDEAISPQAMASEQTR